MSFEARAIPQPARARTAPGWAAQVWCVLRKDVAIELATGEVVVTSGFFGLLIVVIASLAFYGGPASQRLVGAGVIWVSLSFSAVLALGKTWQRERDESALEGLLLLPLARSAIFAGKALGVLAFLLAISALVIPISALLFSLDLTVVGGGLVCIALAAAPGLAASGTLFGAMTVRTQARDLLLAVVLFPLLTPTLLCAVAATRELFAGASLAELGDYFRLLGVFDLVFIAGGLGLFGSLIER